MVEDLNSDYCGQIHLEVRMEIELRASELQVQASNHSAMLPPLNSTHISLALYIFLFCFLSSLGCTTSAESNNSKAYFKLVVIFCCSPLHFVLHVSVFCLHCLHCMQQKFCCVDKLNPDKDDCMHGLYKPPH